MAGRRTRGNFHPEASWRVVEAGLNDSFETSYLNDGEASDANPSQSFDSTQPYSQSFSIGGSQPWSINGSQDDSLESFLTKAEYDDRVLLRSPFRPSIPEEVRESSRENMAPKFRESLRRKEANGLRRRKRSVSVSSQEDDSQPSSQQEEPSRNPSGVNSPTLGFLGTVARYLKAPLVILASLAIISYIAIAALDIPTASVTESLSPICRLPGVSSFDLAFCSQSPSSGTEDRQKKQSLDLGSFLGLQGEFARASRSALQGNHLATEKEIMETKANDLIRELRSSGLAEKKDIQTQLLGFFIPVRAAGIKLDGFVKALRSAADTFSNLCWEAERELSEDGELPSWVSGIAWAKPLLSRFIPAKVSQQQMLETYAKHLNGVVEEVSPLVSDGHKILEDLDVAGHSLRRIQDLVQEDQNPNKTQGFGYLVKLWFRTGGPKEVTREQLDLLDGVGEHHSQLRKQVGELVVQLDYILEKLYTLNKSGHVGQQVNLSAEQYLGKLRAQCNILSNTKNGP